MIDTLAATGIDLERLNVKYSQLSPAERITELFQDFNRVLVTSSFGSTSLILLDLIARVQPEHPVHFINTGYHFSETMAYQKEIANRLGLQIIELKAKKWQNEITTSERMWESHPDVCCSVNKVEPLEEAKLQHDVWISGLMGWQSNSRKNMSLFEQKESIIKFHPLIDFDAEEVRYTIKNLNLPQHPLLKKGFESIGCSHCTVAGNSREGRWAGRQKIECGLHL